MGHEMQVSPGLALKGLVAGYRGKPVARIGYLTIAAGESGLLSGSSGSGKTSLLLAIAGLVDHMDGTICVDGNDLTTLTPRQRDRHRGRHIGLIFQDLHLVPGLSAIDNMLLAPFATGVPRDHAKANGLLDRLGLASRATARAETLSRGEAQRVAIARAMLMQPKLILADEPTASLDDEAAEAVTDLLLAATQESGAALLVATHDARVRARISQAVAAEPVR